MRKKIAVIILTIASGLTMVMTVTGCGSDDKAGQTQMPDIANVASTGNETLDQRIEDLKKMEMTVEVIEDGKSTGKWSQKEGSWRWDDSNDKTSYVIYNNQKKKTWVVNGNQATETSGSSETSYAGFSPAMILSVYAMMPRTGSSGDTWEYNIPGAGKLAMEMQGPQGLPSKMTSEDAQSGKTSVTEFKYANVGDVPDSMFQLPSSVKITTVDSGGMMPNGSSGMNP